MCRTGQVLKFLLKIPEEQQAAREAVENLWDRMAPDPPIPAFYCPFLDQSLA
jgi:hypothetical protein